MLTTFAIVSGASGGGLSSEVILILGFSNKIADALSMGLGDALSSKASSVDASRRRCCWPLLVLAAAGAVSWNQAA